MIRVLIADDQALVRGGFRLILDSQHDITVVGEAADGLEAVDLATRLQPDVTLMDIRMPGLDGIQATRPAGPQRATTRPHPHHLRPRRVRLRRHAGRRQRVPAQDRPPQQLAAAVRDVASGDALLAPSITRRLVEAFVKPTRPGAGVPDRFDELTPRELDVLRLVAQGLSNARSPTTSWSASRRPRPTCRASSPSSPCATASKRSCSPTSPDSSSPATRPPKPPAGRPPEGVRSGVRR